MPASLRIGVNALYLIPGGVGGTEIYLRNLLAELARVDARNHYLIFLNRETSAEICPKAANFAPVETGVRARFRPLRLIWEQTGLALASYQHRLDVLFNPGFSSPLISRGRQVTVIHDVQHKRQPQNFGWLESAAWNAMVAVSVRSSDCLITVSESARRDLLEIYDVPLRRTRVIRHGVEPAFLGLRENENYGPELPSEAGVPGCRYLLAVSTVHHHKNWSRLLDAFQELRESGRREHLVVCGLPGKAWKEVRERLEREGLNDSVHLLGWQPRKRLIGLFKFAEALVFPSTFEGFGLPVLEAMAAGIPVVCSDIAPLRELAEGAAVFCDPYSSSSIAAALLQVLKDAGLRADLTRAGQQRACQMTWTRTAEQTLAVFLESARR